MPLIISDDALRAAGLTEEDARVEIACRLFDAGRLESAAAARLAQLTRSEFEEALLERGLPLIRWTRDDLASDMESLGRLER